MPKIEETGGGERITFGPEDWFSDDMAKAIAGYKPSIVRDAALKEIKELSHKLKDSSDTDLHMIALVLDHVTQAVEEGPEAVEELLRTLDTNK